MKLEENPVVVIQDLNFSYNRHNVLEGVSLMVASRDFVSIVGPNGGGKTTLLKLMLGLLNPTMGTVKVFGVPPGEARFRMGYMPQHTHLDPLFPVSAMDVVLMARLGHKRLIGSYSRIDKEAAEEALRKLQSWDLRNKQFSSLSGGQRQRVLIARALASGPDLLLLDEPTAGLDLTVETELYDLLRGITEDLTVVMVSHDLGFVSRLVNKVVCVKRRVVVHPTSEITGEIINEIYGSPMKIVRHDLSNSGASHKCISS